MRRYKRKLILFGLVVALTGLASLAFAGQGPQKAKELTFGIYNPAKNITTYSVGNSWNDWILWLVSDKLREPSPYSEEQENWLSEYVKPLSKDYREWEVKLKSGIRWHDGTELTAEDLAFTYMYYRKGPSNRWTHHTSKVPRMEDITMVDKYTIRIKSQWPMPNFDRITAADLAIIQKKQWENVKEPRKFMDLPIGTGPYRLVSYKPDEFYRLEANENYFQGKPLVDKINLVMIRDPQVMFTALKSGEIDGAVRHLPPELAFQWRNAKDVKVIESPSYWGVFFYLNYTRPPFADRKTRNAMTFLLDKKAIVNKILLGQGKPGISGYPHPDAPWTFPNQQQDYDLKEGQKRFEKLGFVDRNGDGFREDPQGKPIDWEILVASSEPLFVRAAEMVKEQLAKAGFKTHVRIADRTSVDHARWVSNKFDFVIGETTPHGLADQDMQMIYYFSYKKNSATHDHIRASLVDDWFHSSSPEARFKASGSYQKDFNAYPSMIALWYPKGFWAFRPGKYDNYQISPGYGIFHKYSFLPRQVRGKTVVK